MFLTGVRAMWLSSRYEAVSQVQGASIDQNSDCTRLARFFSERGHYKNLRSLLTQLLQMKGGTHYPRVSRPNRSMTDYFDSCRNQACETCGGQTASGEKEQKKTNACGVLHKPSLTLFPYDLQNATPSPKTPNLENMFSDRFRRSSF